MTADDPRTHWRRSDGTIACGGDDSEPALAYPNRKHITCRNCAARATEADPTLFYEWTVKIRVNAVWVADGFDLTDERVHDMVSHDLQYAHSYEIETEVVKAPDADEVAREMGYKSAKHRQARPALDALRHTVAAFERGNTSTVALAACLFAYEETGDHNHGHGPIGLGKACEGGDCIVDKARKLLREAGTDALYDATRPPPIADAEGEDGR